MSPLRGGNKRRRRGRTCVPVWLRPDGSHLQADDTDRLRQPHELPRPVCERSDVLHDRFPRLGPLQQLRGQPISATHRRFEPRTGVRVQLLRQRRSDHLPHRDQRHTRQRRHHIHRGRIRHRRHPQLRNLVTQHRSTTGWAWLRPGPPLDHVQALSVRGVIGVHEQIEKMKNLILMLLGPSARELVAIPDP